MCLLLKGIVVVFSRPKKNANVCYFTLRKGERCNNERARHEDERLLSVHSRAQQAKLGDLQYCLQFSVMD